VEEEEEEEKVEEETVVEGETEVEEDEESAELCWTCLEQMRRVDETATTARSRLDSVT